MTDHTGPRWVVQYRRAGEPDSQTHTISIATESAVSALKEAQAKLGHPFVIVGLQQENGTLVYGHDRTIHRTELLNVEVDKEGKVVSVWFRCMALPFDQTVVDDHRAAEMRRMSAALGVSLKAVTVEHGK